jgi:hypothetical protein
MEPGITWYEVLGVLPGAAADRITVHVWHPPTRPGAG